MINTKKQFPNLPGVYLFKNAAEEIIYIGKALSIKKRVASYFQKQHTADWKIDYLLAEHTDIDWITTRNETEALLLETQLIQQYKPKYNIIAKDGQPFVYIVCTNNQIPTLKIVRNKKLKGTYFGPFFHKTKARQAHRFLLQTFQLNICNKKIVHGCLDYHLGTCPGSCKPNFDIADYTFKLNLALDVLHNNHHNFTAAIKSKIKEYNQHMAFEKAQHLNHYLENLDAIFQTIQTKFSPDKFATDIFIATTPMPTVEDSALILQKFLNLSVPVNTIDCFDISHFQSKYMVGSCVRFANGKPDKNKFRRFMIKTLTQQDDCAALQEIVTRRYKNGDFPDVILIDGGKGQLNAVRTLIPHIPCISLAKKEERLYSTNYPDGIHLDLNTLVGQRMIALRDYAHHFAISYHRFKRNRALHEMQ